MHTVGHSCDVFCIKGFTVPFLLRVTDDYKPRDLFHDAKTVRHPVNVQMRSGRVELETQPGSLGRCSFRLRNTAGCRPPFPPADNYTLRSGFMDSVNHTEKFKLELRTALVDLCHQTEARSFCWRFCVPLIHIICRFWLSLMKVNIPS